MKVTNRGGWVHIATALVVALEGLLVGSLVAQETRVVQVDGRAVRVQTAGLERAGQATPVVVFEAGFMNDGLSAWTSILSRVAEFAPVVAYDRAGIGGSEPDGLPPTPRHVAENLRRLLSALGAQPPYVLVGHSLGGPFIQMFAGLFPGEVRGLVFIDTTPTMSEQDGREFEAAIGLTEAGRAAIADLQRKQLPGMPSASLRAEAEMIMAARIDGWSDFQQLGPMPDVPVAILVAGRYDPRPSDGLEQTCEPRLCHERGLAVRREWYAKQLAGIRRGWLTVGTDAGHFIQNDDPDLVVWTIRRVWSSQPPRTQLLLDPAILERFVGVYRRSAASALTVTRENDQLFAQLTGQAAFAIFAETDTEFYYRVVDATLSFERGQEGSARWVVLTQNGRQTRWERAR
jgi:pimeloyl-ACP methyl ester carboxylesterase